MSSDTHKKIIIGIVAYNAENTVSKVLDRIPQEVKEKVSEIAVFDDESKDKTFEVANQYKEKNPWLKNFNIYRNPNNLGYGGNQTRLYRYAIEKGYDVAVLLHGDGQYAPEELSKLLAPLENDEAQAVFGSRMMNKGAARQGGMPLYKFVGNKILTFVENKMLGMNLTEFHSGYRLYDLHALNQIPFERNTNDFHFDTEIIVQFHAHRFKIKELPIPVYYGDEICHVNGMKYAFDVVRSVIQYKIHKAGIRNYAKYDIGFKKYAFKKDPYSSHGRVIKLIASKGEKILDIGCGPGDLAKFLKKDGNYVVGVDEYPANIDSGYDKIIQKDIEGDFDLGLEREFDTVLFLDVLEHLKHPEFALQNARKYLKTNGRIIVSVPNIAHWSIRLSLFFGVFNYGDRGILDKTHLHFYTIKTIKQLLKENNYKAVNLSATPLPLSDAFPVFRYFPLNLVHLLGVFLSIVWKRLFGYQFVIEARDTFNADYDIVSNRRK